MTSIYEIKKDSFWEAFQNLIIFLEEVDSLLKEILFIYYMFPKTLTLQKESVYNKRSKYPCVVSPMYSSWARNLLMLFFLPSPLHLLGFRESSGRWPSERPPRCPINFPLRAKGEYHKVKPGGNQFQDLTPATLKELNKISLA